MTLSEFTEHVIAHTDWGLTIATVGLTWATVHLWSDREKSKMRSKMKPWRHLHSSKTTTTNDETTREETDYAEGE